MVPSLAIIMEKVSTPKPFKHKIEYKLSNKKISLRSVMGLSGVIIIVTAISLFYAGKISFEYNFNNLGSKIKVSCPIKYGRTLSQSSSPVVAVLNSPDDARKMTRYMDKVLKSKENSDGLLKNAFSIFTFIPKDQPVKLKLLRELSVVVNDALGLHKLSEDTRKKLQDIKVWSKADAVTLENLPEWVKGKFTQKDGTIGTMVYLFPGISEFHSDKMASFYDKYGLIDVPEVGRVRPAASGFILVEVIRAVQHDGIVMTVAAIIVVLFLLFIDLRSIKGTLLTFIPLLVGLIWTGGFMGVLDIKLGLYNMLMLPMLLGIGIDASVHFYHSYLEQGTGSIKYVFKTTGMAVLVASITTGVGFAGMLIVSHNGLRTIGELAVLGIFTSLAGSLITVAVLLALVERFNTK